MFHLILITLRKRGAEYFELQARRSIIFPLNLNILVLASNQIKRHYQIRQ